MEKTLHKSVFMMFAFCCVTFSSCVSNQTKPKQSELSSINITYTDNGSFPEGPWLDIKINNKILKVLFDPYQRTISLQLSKIDVELLSDKDRNKLTIGKNISSIDIGDDFVLRNIVLSKIIADSTLVNQVPEIGLEAFKGYNLLISLKSGIIKIYPKWYIPDEVKSWTCTSALASDYSDINIATADNKIYRCVIDLTSGIRDSNIGKDIIFDEDLYKKILSSNVFSISGQKYVNNDFTFINGDFSSMILGRYFFMKHDLFISPENKSIYISK